MEYVTEYVGAMGTVYAPWAFKEDEDAKRDANRELYGRILERLGTSQREQAFRRTFEAGGLRFERLEPRYKRICFRVDEKPDWMTWAEVALVCDDGNLCFGFSVSGNFIDVYTD